MFSFSTPVLFLRPHILFVFPPSFYARRSSFPLSLILTLLVSRRISTSNTMSLPLVPDDQQLLQDALTLLMFANVAAGKQGSPPLQPQPPPQPQPPNPHRDPLYQGYHNWQAAPPGAPPVMVLTVQRHHRQALDPMPSTSVPLAVPPAATKMDIFSLLDNRDSAPAPRPHKSSINMFLNEDNPVAPVVPIPPAAPVAPTVSTTAPPTITAAATDPSVPAPETIKPSPTTGPNIPSPPTASNHKRLKLSPSQSGPGPLLATQAMQGIDIKAKERSNQSAVIAARALAAAAEVPLPPRFPEKKVEKQDIEVKTEVVIPPLVSYRVDPDLGLIGCICGLEDDDGFTIQCDQCYRWQHCVCMGYATASQVPEDEYRCYYCDPAKHGKFNPESCRRATEKRMVDGERPKQPLPKKRKPLATDHATKKRKPAPEANADVPPEPMPLIFDRLPLPENPLLEDGVTTEPYQLVYFKVKQNDYKTTNVKRQLTEGIANDMSEAEFKQLKFARVILPKYDKYMAKNHRQQLGKARGHHNKFWVQVKPYLETPKQKFNGMVKLALFMGLSDSDVHIIPKGTLVTEYRGELDLFTNYANDSINQYPHWGVPKPKVVKTTIGNTEIVCDARFVGNELRFIRKLCPDAANCKIRALKVDSHIRLVVETTADIEIKSEHGVEIRLPWEWDKSHPILCLYGDDTRFETTVPLAEKPALLSYVDNMLYFCECGCLTALAEITTACAVAKVKRAIAQLMRTTRKALGISNVNLSRTKEEIIFGDNPSHYVLWDERLVKRDQVIQVLVTVEPAVKEEVTPPTKPLGLLAAPFRHKLVSKLVPPVEVSANVLFPVVPSLTQKIDEQVEEALKPAAEALEQQVEELAHSAPLSVAPSPVISFKPEPVEVAETIREPPKPVKKLSFADYKKKKM